MGMVKITITFVEFLWQSVNIASKAVLNFETCLPNPSCIHEWWHVGLSFQPDSGSWQSCLLSRLYTDPDCCQRYKWCHLQELLMTELSNKWCTFLMFLQLQCLQYITYSLCCSPLAQKSSLPNLPWASRFPCYSCLYSFLPFCYFAFGFVNCD